MMAFPLPTAKPSKRKREDTDSLPDSPPIPPPSHRQQQPLFNPQESAHHHLLDQDELARSNSPRTTVAGYLGHLEIYESASEPELKHRAIAKDGKIPVRGQVGASEIGSGDGLGLPANDDDSSSQPTPSREPATPHSSAKKKKKGKASTPRTPKSSPKGKQVSPTPQRPQQQDEGTDRRSKSPPLSSERDVDPLTWSDAEITGHLGEDPDDDGYGINGLGFRPTPALARSRSERRMKQIAEWKAREAREAREARQSRRRGRDSSGNTPGTANPTPSPKKVKFQA